MPVTKNNQNKFNLFRQKYSKVVFDAYTIKDTNKELSVAYHFKVDDQHKFSPSFSISWENLKIFGISTNDLDSFIFQIGMVELISYWKAMCPAEVIIRAGALDGHQILFWKKLYFNGLGEFFYLNEIDTDLENFMHLKSEGNKIHSPLRLKTKKERVLVPVGGGKDSVVTLELLRDKLEVIPMIINPRKASIDTTKIAGFNEQQIFTIYRTIDPHLLELNKQGYLNGHTPFSALLAFMTLMAGAITKSGFIALSNESSANEPTVENGANHQYSKSFEFEEDFRKYTQKYLTPDINYFSFLRPLNEYGIARIFAKLTKYHSSFRSCNAGSKRDIWCGQCPKCLFTFIMLSPFIDAIKLAAIFEKNLFEDSNLIPYLDELCGIAEEKPFECVGTIDEVNVALKQTIQKYKTPLPVLLQHYQKHKKGDDLDRLSITRAFDQQHFLKSPFIEILKSAMND